MFFSSVVAVSLLDTAGSCTCCCGGAGRTVLSSEIPEPTAAVGDVTTDVGGVLPIGGVITVGGADVGCCCCGGGGG